MWNGQHKFTEFFTLPVALSAIWTLDKRGSIHCWVPPRAFLLFCADVAREQEDSSDVHMRMMARFLLYAGTQFLIFKDRTASLPWQDRAKQECCGCRVPLAVPAMESTFRGAWDANISPWISYLPLRIYSHHLFLENSSIWRNATHLNEPLRKRPPQTVLLYWYIYC